MATKREQEYKHQERLLKQRIARLEAKGYRFDVDRILEQGRKNQYYATETYKTLKGEKLLKLAIKESDIARPTNEQGFVPPVDRDSPDEFSYIEQIRSLLNEFPDVITDVQFDMGSWGEKDKRDTLIMPSLGRTLRDVFERNVAQAEREGWIADLDDYYGSVEEQLAQLIQPFSELIAYKNESDLRSSHTQALRLLNLGEAISMQEMESYSSLYTDTDVYEE